MEKVSSQFIALLRNWLFRIFAICWVLIMALDFLAHDHNFWSAWVEMKFVAVPLAGFLLMLALLFLHRKGKWGIDLIGLQKISGWKIYTFLFLLTAMVYGGYSSALDLYPEGMMEPLISFLISSFTGHLVVLLLLLTSASIGTWIMRVFNPRLPVLSSELFAIALGLVVLSLYIFIISSLHLLNALPLILLALLTLGISYRQSLSRIRNWFMKSLPDFGLSPLAIIVFYLALLFIAFTMVSMNRPVPTGFDELSLYMNIPHLMSSYHRLISGSGAYNWGLIMSVGFSLQDSIFLPSLLSVFPGILCIPVLYAIAKRFMDNSFALISASVFVFLPSVYWQSSSDAKVDLALTFVSLVLLLLALDFGHGDEKEIEPLWRKKIPGISLLSTEVQVSILAGIISGFAFGIKYTALFYIFGFVSVFSYRIVKHSLIAFAFSMLGISVLFFTGIYKFSGVVFSNPDQAKVLGMFLAAPALLILAYLLYRETKKLAHVFICLVLLGAFAFLDFSPWMIKNYRETNSFAINDLLNGKSDLAPLVSKESESKQSDKFRVSHELYVQSTSSSDQIKPSEKTSYSKEVVKTSVSEEIVRYIGYEPGAAKFISVFRDLSCRTNVDTIPVGIGFFFIALLPLSLISHDDKLPFLNLGKFFFFMLFLLISIRAEIWDGRDWKALLDVANPKFSPSLKHLYISMHESFLSVSSFMKPLDKLFFGPDNLYAYAMLLCLIMIFSLLNYSSYKKGNINRKSLWWLALVPLWFWWWLGSGVTWYAMGVLAVLPVLIMGLFYERFKATSDNFMRWFISGVIVLSCMSLAISRLESLVPSYPFESPLNSIILNYGGGQLASGDAMLRMNPSTVPAIEEMNAHKEMKVLRVGTYLNYFIEENDRRVYEDNQLDFFNNVYTRFEGMNYMVGMNLKRMGIGYILFDLNSGSLDNTPGKTLSKKVQNFYSFLSGNDGLELVATDRWVEDPRSTDIRSVRGQNYPVSNSIYGKQVLIPGSFVLLKLI